MEVIMNQGLPKLKVLIVASDNNSKTKIIAAVERLLKNSEVIESYETASGAIDAREIFEKERFNVLFSHQVLLTTHVSGENLAREFKEKDNDLITILLTRDPPWDWNGVDRTIMTKNYDEVFVDNLREIAASKL